MRREPEYPHLSFKGYLQLQLSGVSPGNRWVSTHKRFAKRDLDNVCWEGAVKKCVPAVALSIITPQNRAILGVDVKSRALVVAVTNTRAHFETGFCDGRDPRYWMPSMEGMVAKPTSSSSSVGMWSVILQQLQF